MKMQLDIVTPTGTFSQDVVLTGAWSAWPLGYSTRWPHFKPYEFRSGDGCERLLIYSDLLDGLELLRTGMGGHAIHINSGFRTKEWNKEVGGEPDSRHLLGAGSDIVVSGFTPDEVARYAERIEVFHNSGIGIYPKRGFVHLDVGRSRPARWRK